MILRLDSVCYISFAALLAACSDSSTPAGNGAGAGSGASGGSNGGSSGLDGGYTASPEASTGGRDSSSAIPGVDAGADDSRSGGGADTGSGMGDDAAGSSVEGGSGSGDSGSVSPIDAGPVGPAGPVDITGTVVDKRWALIAGAQVCFQGSAVGCVTSGADGIFHIQGAGPLALIITKSGFAPAVYRPKMPTETSDLVLVTAPGENVSLLFDGKTLDGWLPSSGTGLGNAPGTWDVQDSALHCVGTLRGTLVTKSDYSDYRLIFAVRQLPFTLGDNHYASVLVWGSRPPPNDALGALQFGNPNGYYWDYRPGKPGAGTGFFVATPAGLSRTMWSQCEILTQVATGVARMACCTLAGAGPCKSVEVLRFTDPTAGKLGPIGLQNHSPGGHDEYKNITLETSPSVTDLITNK